jgi:hypothetical protein
MTSDTGYIKELGTHLILIGALLRSLEKDSDTTLHFAKDELTKIALRLKDPVDLDPQAALTLLPAFIQAHPELFLKLVVANADETLAFIASVCDRYQTIKQQRPLTIEEKVVGLQLSQLLDLVQDNLR